jgi:PII-like signaling protein
VAAAARVCRDRPSRARGRSGRASVFRGIEGYGHTGQVRTARLRDLAEDLPMTVLIVDAEAKIRAFVPQVREALGEGNGLITLEPVEVVP